MSNINLYRLLRRSVRWCRGRLVERCITDLGVHGKVSIYGSRQKVIVARHPSARFILNGELKMASFQGGTDPVYIALGTNSQLTIDGDFEIGNGTKFTVASDASLYIGGRRKESASGITAATRIMVYKSIRIGTDFICSWGVYITDCDWHQIAGQEPCIPTNIGNHVWSAPECLILKGSSIGDGCILGANSLMHKCALPPNCLGGGNPFRKLREGVSWSRDMLG